MLNSFCNTRTKTRIQLTLLLVLNGCFEAKNTNLRSQEPAKETANLQLKSPSPQTEHTQAKLVQNEAEESSPQVAPTNSPDPALADKKDGEAKAPSPSGPTVVDQPKNLEASDTESAEQKLSLPDPVLEYPDSVSVVQPFYCSLTFSDKPYQHLSSTTSKELLDALIAEFRILKNGQQLEGFNLSFSKDSQKTTKTQNKKHSTDHEPEIFYKAQVTAVAGIDLGDEFECAARVKLKQDAAGSTLQKSVLNSFDALETTWLKSKKVNARALATIVPKKSISFVDSCQFKQEFEVDLAPGVLVDPESIFIEASGKGVQTTELMPNGYTVALNPQALGTADAISVKFEFQTIAAQSWAEQNKRIDENSEARVLSTHAIHSVFEIHKTDRFDVQPGSMLAVYNGSGLEPKDLTTCIDDSKSRASLTASENFVCAITFENKIACIQKGLSSASGHLMQNSATQPTAVVILQWPHDDTPMQLKASGSLLCVRGSEGSLSCYKEEDQKWRLLKIATLDRQENVASFDLHQEWLCFAHYPEGNSELLCLNLAESSDSLAETSIQKNAEPIQIARVGVFQPQVCAITSRGQALCADLPKKSKAHMTLGNKPGPEAQFDGSSPEKTAVDIGFLAGKPCFLNANGDIKCLTGRAKDFLSAQQDPFIQLATGSSDMCALRQSGAGVCISSDGAERASQTLKNVGNDLRTLATTGQELCAVDKQGRLLCYNEQTHQKVFDSSENGQLQKLGLSLFKVTNQRFQVEQKEVTQKLLR